MTSRHSKRRMVVEESEDDEPSPPVVQRRAQPSSSRVPRPPRTRQSDASPSAPPPPVHQPIALEKLNRWFSNPVQIMDYEKYFAACSVISPRFLDAETFDGDDCNLPAVVLLKEKGLYEFSTIGGDYYEDLVRVFYSNLVWNAEEQTLYSEVKGKGIKISLSTWTNMTHLPMDGVTFTGSGSESLWGDEYDKKAAKEEFIDDRILAGKVMTSGNLKWVDQVRNGKRFKALRWRKKTEKYHPVFHASVLSFSKVIWLPSLLMMN